MLRQVAADVEAGVPVAPASASRSPVSRSPASCSTSSHGSGVRPAVEDRDGVPGGARRLDEVPADEARAAEHENPHAPSLRNLAVARRGSARAQRQRGGEPLAHGEVLDARERVGVERRDEHLLGLARAAKPRAMRKKSSSESTRLTVAACVQRTSLARIWRPGIESACAWPESSRLRFSWNASVPLRARVDLDDPAPDRARVTAQRALVGEIADGVRRRVLLRGVEIEVLALAQRVQAGGAHRRAGAAEARLLAGLAELAAEAEREPAQRRVARDLGPRRAEVVASRGAAPGSARGRPRRRRRARARARR